MAEKRLSELSPEFELDRLFFECPACEKPHSIRIPMSLEGKGKDMWGSPIWKRVGNTVDDLTISPSINCSSPGGCQFHGWIKKGVVSW